MERFKINLIVEESLKSVINQGLLAGELVPLGLFQCKEWYPNYLALSKHSTQDCPMLSYIPASRFGWIEGNPFESTGIRQKARIGKVIRMLLQWQSIEHEPEQWRVKRITDAIVNLLYPPASSYQLPDGYQAYIFKDKDSFIEAYTHDSSGYYPIYSCMVNKPDFIELYYDNPDIFNIGVLLNEDGSIVSRAIIHPTIKFYDRVYGNYEEKDIMEKWLQSKGMKPIYENYTVEYCYEIDMRKYDKIPFLDTFRSADEYHLYNYNATGSTDIQTQNGFNPFCELKIKCLYCGNILTDEHEIIDIDDESYCNECVTYSDYDSCYYLTDDCIYSEWESSYIRIQDSCNLYDGTVCHDNNAVTLYNRQYACDSDDRLAESVDGDYFILA